MATQNSLANDTEIVRNGIYPDYDNDIGEFIRKKMMKILYGLMRILRIIMSSD
jgi:hypothetical protein